MFLDLKDRGFVFEFHSHAEAILKVDFPDAVAELESALAAASVPIEEIIAGGGGEGKNTQRLRRSLAAAGWETKEFTIEKKINGIPRESITHKMDHVRSFKSDGGGETSIALEIEWNNKDPFYDRDLENFKRLHAEGAISLGVIVTRGRSLHENMRDLVLRFFDERQIQNFDDLLRWGYDPTAKQRSAILKRVERGRDPVTFREAFADKFVSDKFGEATTHWRKLDDRIRRGVGNPCPLLLVGLPDTIVTFGEDPSVIDDVIRAVSVDEG